MVFRAVVNMKDATHVYASVEEIAYISICMTHVANIVDAI